MYPLRLFLLDQGFPVEYELDEFNTPHTRTTLCHPQNWLCRLRCKIPLRHLITLPLGNIFWRHSRFFPKQPEPQTHGDFNVSFLKQQTRLLLHYGEHISLARPTTHASFSTLSLLQIVTLLLSFLRDLQHKHMLPLKNPIKKTNGIFVFLLLHLLLYFTTKLREWITHTHKNTFLR